MSGWPAWIRRLLIALAPPLCCSCGSHAGPLEPLCRDCRAELRWLGPDAVVVSGVSLWAPLAYDGPARALVRELKFGGRAGLAEAMAAQIAANAPDDVLRDAAVLVPVPLHPARLRRRGFNQAERLAAALARRTGLSVCDCLERVGGAGTQMGRARSERVLAMRESVRVRRCARVPRSALLVDDVVTTGATLSACAAALRAAGADSVRAVAYARTPGR